MKISRKRFIAVRDDRTRVLMDSKSFPTWKNGRRLTRQESIDSAWRKFEEIGQARILSWNTKNTALAALKQGVWTEGVPDVEIVEMTETFEI